MKDQWKQFLPTEATGTSQLLFRDLIWDPWWFTPDKKGTSDPEQVILWGCGPGFVVRSDDAAKNWQDITTYISDPPNTWGDSPAPTVADITKRLLIGLAVILLLIAAMVLPGGIALIFGVVVIVIVFILTKRGGGDNVHTTIEGNNNTVTTIIDKSRGAE